MQIKSEHKIELENKIKIVLNELFNALNDAKNNITNEINVIKLKREITPNFDRIDQSIKNIIKLIEEILKIKIDEQTDFLKLNQKYDEIENLINLAVDSINYFKKQEINCINLADDTNKEIYFKLINIIDTLLNKVKYISIYINKVKGIIQLYYNKESFDKNIHDEQKHNSYNFLKKLFDKQIRLKEIIKIDNKQISLDILCSFELSFKTNNNITYREYYDKSLKDNSKLNDIELKEKIVQLFKNTIAYILTRNKFMLNRFSNNHTIHINIINANTQYSGYFSVSKSNIDNTYIMISLKDEIINTIIQNQNLLTESSKSYSSLIHELAHSIDSKLNNDHMNSLRLLLNDSDIYPETYELFELFNIFKAEGFATLIDFLSKNRLNKFNNLIFVNVKEIVGKNFENYKYEFKMTLKSIERIDTKSFFELENKLKKNTLIYIMGRYIAFLVMIYHIINSKNLRSKTVLVKYNKTKNMIAKEPYDDANKLLSDLEKIDLKDIGKYLNHPSTWLIIDESVLSNMTTLFNNMSTPQMFLIYNKVQRELLNENEILSIQYFDYFNRLKKEQFKQLVKEMGFK